MQLDATGENAGIKPRYSAAPTRFTHLIRALHRDARERVVVLVDECDKPIPDALAEPETAGANRDFLRGFYGVFAPELDSLDRDEVRCWYNGYGWLGEGKVYNPFDILRLFRRGRFGNYWFETDGSVPRRNGAFRDRRSCRPDPTGAVGRSR